MYIRCECINIYLGYADHVVDNTDVCGMREEIGCRIVVARVECRLLMHARG